jgi:hypothetical protein
MTNQCPKCGSEDSGLTVERLVGVPGATIHRCGSCARAWTDWQQAEIERLNRLINDDTARCFAVCTKINDKEQENIPLRSEIERLKREVGHLEVALKAEIKTRILAYNSSQYEKNNLEEEIERLQREKNARIYYQTIVYQVCAVLDHNLKTTTVCGTLESPSNEVGEGMNKLIERLEKRQPLSPFCIECDESKTREEISRLRAVLKIFAERKHWEDAGTYMRKPSGVYLWKGWYFGIQEEPWKIAKVNEKESYGKSQNISGHMNE